MLSGGPHSTCQTTGVPVLCPLSCEDISDQATCPPDQNCSSPAGPPEAQNLTGITVQGPVSLDLLQLSSDSLHWHCYSDILPPAKVLATWVPWASDPPCPIVGSTVFVPKASSHLKRYSLH
ncbi:Sco-Spondin [Manis pentadactyla]|nr:Sco-Spondin [Manis pentadactyla]